MVATPCRQNIHCVSIVLLYNVTTASPVDILAKIGLSDLSWRQTSITETLPVFFFFLIVCCWFALVLLTCCHRHTFLSLNERQEKPHMALFHYSVSALLTSPQFDSTHIFHNNWAQAWRGWGRHIHINTITFQCFQLLSMHFWRRLCTHELTSPRRLDRPQKLFRTMPSTETSAPCGMASYWLASTSVRLLRFRKKHSRCCKVFGRFGFCEVLNLLVSSHSAQAPCVATVAIFSLFGSLNWV